MAKKAGRGAGRPPAASNPKRGFLSRLDKGAIERQAGRKSAEQIALEIRRPADQVRRYLEEIGSADPTSSVGPSLSLELEGRPEWAELRAQYDAEELKFIKYRYVQLMNQFGKDDVLPTEEMQIFSLIHLEVMANQAMRERKTLVTQQKLVQAQLEAGYERLAAMAPGEAGEKAVKAAINGLAAEFTQISDCLKNIHTRHASYTMQQTSLLQQLKATRDQRVKVVEGSKASFLGFLKALTDEGFRKSVGDEMEMMRLAMAKEKGRLSREAEYIDGTKDRPLLTPESVLGDDTDG